MAFLKSSRTLFFIFTAACLASACSGPKKLAILKNDAGFHISTTPVDSIIAQLPDYSTRLSTLKGKGKAVVSEPDHSQRVTLYFSSTRRKSLITAKNSLGIEGGELLTNGDSLLIYDKVNHYARKISIKTGHLENINHLATVNLVHIMNIPVKKNGIKEMLESTDLYLLQLKNSGKVYVDKKTLRVKQIDQPRSANVAYSRIIYDAYDTIDGLSLPRRITIFSADKSSKIALLIQSLEVNPALGELKIDLPDNIKIYRR